MDGIAQAPRDERTRASPSLSVSTIFFTLADGVLDQNFTALLPASRKASARGQAGRLWKDPQTQRPPPDRNGPLAPGGPQHCLSDLARLGALSAAHDRAPVAQSRAIRANGLDARAGQAPREARRHVEQLARRPAHFGRFSSLCVEKPAAVIEDEPPFGLRHVERFLMIEPRHASR